MDTPHTHQPFDPEQLQALGSDEAFRKRATEIRADVKEAQRERTPKTENPTKTARQAEQAEELMEAIHPLLAGLNKMLGDRYPGLEYTPGQVDFVATLGGKIASKYVDISIERYGEEITLGMFLLTTGVQKGLAVYQLEQRKNGGSRRTREPAEANGEASE